VELILIVAGVMAGVLLIVLGRRGRARSPEGSVFDAAGGGSIRGRKPARSRAQDANGRLADLGQRRIPAPAPAAEGQEPAAPPIPPAPAPPPGDAPPPTPPAPALPLGDTSPPAWPVAAPPPDWSHTLAQATAWSSPAGTGLDRELAEAKERAERAERALQAERREREERERRSGT
jgi:hypothetical protein